MLKYCSLLLVFLLLLTDSSVLFAAFRPVPGWVPSLVPKVENIKEKKAQKKWKPLQNTPALEWQMIRKGKSIEVFHNGTGMVFVQKINLNSGATIGSLFRFHAFDALTGEPLYERFSPQTELKNYSHPPFSYINGQFFDPSRRHTPFSFGFKLRNTILTAWADNRSEKKTIFSYSQRWARIIQYSWEALEAEQADFALVNLTLDDSHEDDWYMGRTYICLVRPDASGYSHQVMTFSFLRATERYAENIMSSWWCERQNISKLDSSGSSVFWMGQEHFAGYSHRGKPDNRRIPQIITFYDE